MKRVTGIGGIFFRAQDPAALRAWYQSHLGIDVQSWGGSVFRWAGDDGEAATGMTVWSIGEGKNFAPSTAPFMINYRVADLDALLAQLRAEGCEVLDSTADPDHGKFGWVLDPEGNKLELWEPPAGM